MNELRFATVVLLAAACGGGGGEDPPPSEQPDGGSTLDPQRDYVPALPEPDDGCPAVFAQNQVPTYRVTLAESERAALEDEFLHRAERVAAGLPEHPYHPIELRYGDGAPVSAMIRLKGNSSWDATVMLDAKPKMQFVLAFNEADPDGRFMGQRKIDLDMPRNDQSFLRQRIALLYLRQLGQPAQCASSARLEINGEYYGLYTAIERMDKEFLQRQFGDDDEGDLFEGGVDAKTNEDSFDWQKLDAFWKVTTVAELDALADLDAAVEEWAAEAMVLDPDGYYAGRPNFYLYDHPDRGYLWLANDLDAAIDYAPADLSPLFPSRSHAARPHHALLLDDPVWREKYVAALRKARAAFDVAELQARVDEYSRQIARAADADPHRPFGMTNHRSALVGMRSLIAQRATFIDGWLACRDHGGTDADGDGFDFCQECDDSDATAFPGATEVCNGLDDDCDGRIDDGVTCP
jgi:CotH kinase protein/Putative metal-binding motif